ncbi:MAG: outer membrane beta-barrel protein, partial [Proteobacteria bacterium]|nr:outer membrane beta-barrel protein [Pseudomonadota bacterium]
MKKTLAVVAALAVLPAAAQAQTLQYPGFYAGLEGGGTYMFNTTVQTPGFGGTGNIYPALGWAAGAMIGYDFVGPRVELEGVYRYNQATMNALGGNNFGASKDDISVMANVLYDFNAGGVITPYVGAGAGVAFVHSAALGVAADTTQFAYQGIVGIGYNIDSQFRVNLDGRYYGTTSPSFGGLAGSSYQNNNISAMLSLQVKFGAPTVVAAAPEPMKTNAPSFMVFFDWDRSNLSAQAVNTIKQAAGAYKTKG